MDWTPNTDLRIHAGGRRLEARVWGPPPGEAPTIVMLHEGLGSVSMWKGFPEAVAGATGHGVLAYSRAGYGRSDRAELPRPLDYMTREAVDVLPGALDAAGIRRAVLLGHSDGATIAAIHGGQVADPRVRGLILIAPHFFTEPVGLAAIAEARGAFEAGDLRARLARHHDDPDHAFRGWNDAWLDPAFAAWNVADVIDYLRIPVLAIQGRDDQYGTLAQIDEIETRIYSPFERAILDAHHAPHLEAPEATLAAVAEFAARLDRLERERVAVA